MQDFTEKDIRLYIERQLMKNNEEAAALTTEIANKAKGLFLWVRLVVTSCTVGLVNGYTRR